MDGFDVDLHNAMRADWFRHERAAGRTKDSERDCWLCGERPGCYQRECVWYCFCGAREQMLPKGEP